MKLKRRWLAIYASQPFYVGYRTLTQTIVNLRKYNNKLEWKNKNKFK